MSEFASWVQQLVSLLPDGKVGYTLRRWFYRGRLKSCGHFAAMSGFKIFGTQTVSIGSRVTFNVGVVIDGSHGEIRIGDDVLMGPYCVLRAADHGFDDVSRPIREQEYVSGTIIVEDDVWLGSHVVVKGGVTIGRGSVIGAHSVVTKDIPPYSVAIGVPARVATTRPQEPVG